MGKYKPYEKDYVILGKVVANNKEIQLNLNNSYGAFYKNHRLSGEFDNSLIRFEKDKVFKMVGLGTNELTNICADAITTISKLETIGAMRVGLGNLRIESNKLICGEDKVDLNTPSRDLIYTMLKEHDINTDELLIIIIERMAKFCFDKEKIRDVTSIYCNGEVVNTDELVYLRRKSVGSRVGIIESMKAIDGNYCIIVYKGEADEYVVAVSELLKGKYDATDEVKQKYSMLNGGY